MPFCVKCGTKLPETASFCPKCGTATQKGPDLGELVTDALRTAGKEIEAAFKTAREEIERGFGDLRNDLSGRGGVFCQKCGKRNPLGSVFCFSCGSKIPTT
jgi:uncharacterized membrane protein YvbJ